jgi:hypothetical protein
MKAISASVAVAIALSSYGRASPIEKSDNGTMASSFGEVSICSLNFSAQSEQ